tara:strand:- start:796 stop:1335 length:540 start_codon:yes stop_codon:yes gene_type:complete
MKGYVKLNKANRYDYHSMRKALVLISMLAMTAPAHADITHKLSSSVQLNVQSAATQATRIGSSYNVSGSGVDTTDGTTANTISAGTITSGVYNPGTISVTQDVPGAAFSYSATYTQADAVPTSAPTVGAVGNFGSMTSNASGSAGDLAGTITSAGAMTLTAGGAGTTATGQFVTELTVD